MKIISYKDISDFEEKIANIAITNKSIDAKISEDVSKIISSVKTKGDLAIIDICNKFDDANFKTASDLLVNEEDIDNSINRIDKDLLSALKLSYERIFSYHKKQIPKDFEYKDDIGTTLGNRWKPIQSVCVYAPGGTAIYPSSILMSGVPAIVAGVKNIVASVPSRNGKIDDSVLAACKLCGIKKIYKAGGAAAIAAFAYGTDSIKKVNKIVGPGNSYVALAKKQLFGTVGIDMIAGPTDILVVADDSIESSWVAADLLSQLEHGTDSRAILITDNKLYCDKVLNSLSELVSKLSRRDIIKESLKKSFVIIVENIKRDSPRIINDIAPEHLEIMIDDPESIADNIVNAGAIFMGKYTPEAIGDYVAGPSHTLPTMSSAKFSSGLSVFDFLKRISIISCSKESLEELSAAASSLAACEGFDAHKLSVEIRNEN